MRDGIDLRGGAALTFCNPFDETLATQGPPAIFLPDREGLLRFDESWTRDAWGRNPGPHALSPAWGLVRDHATRFVTLVLVTSPSLLADWPGADVRLFSTRDEADAARSALGALPMAGEPW